MEINIGERFIITCDKYNWILQERVYTDPIHKFSKSTEPKEKIVDIGYFSKLEHLVNRVISEELKSSDSKTLEELLTFLKHVENKVKTYTANIQKVSR